MNFYQAEPVFAYVNGIDGARNYPLPFGRSAILMDSQDALFYFKTANQMGQSSIKAYRFEETKLDTHQPSDLADITRKVDELYAKIMGGKKDEPASKQQQPA